MKANQRKMRNRAALHGIFALVALLLVTGSAWANSEPVPFVCTGEAYTVRGNPIQGQLFRINQTSTPFVFVQIGSGATLPGPGRIQVNNLGYRSTDNLLYAIAMPLTGNINYGIIQIDSTGAVFPFGPLTGTPLPNARFLAGDVTPDGNTFYINTYPSSTLYIVDLVTKNVTTQSLSGGPVYVADWAVNPVNGLLYGAEGVSDVIQYAPIYELDPTTGVITNIGEATNLPVNGDGPEEFYGGCWFNSAGSFFVYRNSDWIYEIDLNLSVPAVPEVVIDFAGSAVSSQLNDAAACAIVNPDDIQRASIEINDVRIDWYEGGTVCGTFTVTNEAGGEFTAVTLGEVRVEFVARGARGVKATSGATCGIIPVASGYRLDPHEEALFEFCCSSLDPVLLSNARELKAIVYVENAWNQLGEIRIKTWRDSSLDFELNGGDPDN
ncbi:hypothetical protein LCGC14_0841590 [marine sediment metagenome]|uniref:DUF6923 domain-containing protein n=1 Tax=marine sediment metagenome TaxID=412755 RepID=A0A0F9PHN3_9ZZZZ|nr:hypothetical protein [Candidatus Aminicenantes bacterium]